MNQLTEAVDLLARVGREAGLDEQAARVEGQHLAAAVLEQPGPGEAHTLWAQAFGRPASDFFGAVPKGRRYASIPTPLLSTLVAERSPRAAGYAQALADVATAACTVSGAGSLSVGKAASVARAQLATAGVAPAHGAGSPTAGLTPPDAGPSVTPGALPGGAAGASSLSADLLRRAQEQSARVRDMLTSLSAGSQTYQPAPTQPPAPEGAAPDAGGAEPPYRTSGGDEAPYRTSGGEEATGGADPQAPRTQTQSPPGDGAEAEPEEEAQPERSVEELLAELDELIGLERVKAEIHRQVAVLKMDARRQEAGLKVATLTRHLVFVGNPGTGKTTVARLVGGIYRALGLLSKGQLVEVDRSELVAGYLGQTAAKTAEVVGSAHGGVIFIDEAYSLGGDQYGKEAIDTLVKEMEDHREDLVVIVAGYPDPMADFIATNPGLESRFRTIIEFEDYTDEELLAIQQHLAGQMDYDVAPEATERFGEILAATPRGPSFGNARFARNLLEAAIGRHAWRLRDAPDVDVDQLRTLQREDFEDRDAVDLSTLAPGAEEAVDEVADEAPGEVADEASDEAADGASGEVADDPHQDDAPREDR
ncbi:putative RuBisCo-expression protein CbbX [Serinicoccus hydrothermalis]|uniref:Putative RuBisCo-expression protein CbbX n=1 Tax=Serinicoccus hydrothermalis TaxID=1758689 RepID=A0A1B1NA67_9MICO|nr:AAA family ATPase [Serinicoccus hydrothermalis]ANS78316.1 putative RuBisCo-expression protein CbbX [Serinicoccus hydrothermalis]